MSVKFMSAAQKRVLEQAAGGKLRIIVSGPAGYDLQPERNIRVAVFQNSGALFTVQQRIVVALARDGYLPPVEAFKEPGTYVYRPTLDGLVALGRDKAEATAEMADWPVPGWELARVGASA